MAFKISSFLTAENSMRLNCLPSKIFFSLQISTKCHAISSPSLSGSRAKKISSDFFIDFNRGSTFFLSTSHFLTKKSFLHQYLFRFAVNP